MELITFGYPATGGSADGSGIHDVLGATGPSVSIKAGSGVDSVVRSDNNVFINSANSGLDGTPYTTKAEVASSGFATRSELTTSGYVKQSDLLTSGYVRNIDFVASGFETKTNVTTSGYVKQADLLASGYVRNIDFVASGFETKSNITTSGYVKQSDMLVSGFLKHADLLGSGYVRSVNGLSNTPTISPGSGIQSVSAVGNNIYITASGASIRLVGVDLPWNDVTLQPISGLEYAMGPNEIVCGKAVIYYLSNNNTVGLGLSLTGPASPALVNIGYFCTLSTLTFGTSGYHSTSAYPTGSFRAASSPSVPLVGTAYMDFVIINGSNSGFLIPQMSAEVAGTQVDVYQGSYVLYHRG